MRKRERIKLTNTRSLTVAFLPIFYVREPDALFSVRLFRPQFKVFIGFRIAFHQFDLSWRQPVNNSFANGFASEKIINIALRDQLVGRIKPNESSNDEGFL